jgi:glycosyltransferase involved in cell wall biosynthesis
MTPFLPTILIGCYFPRSVAIEGVGTLVQGLVSTFRTRRWNISLVLPEGSSSCGPGTEITTYSQGLWSFRRYREALQRQGVRAQAVLLLENNPNLVGSADASPAGRNTFCFFCTPLQTLRAAAQMGVTRQAVLHALVKHVSLARFHNWSDKRCIVGSAFQAAQLQRFKPAEVHIMRVGGISRDRPIPSREEARKQLGWDGRPVVGYLGHFSPAKGVDVLVKAFARCDGRAVLALAHSGQGRLCRRVAGVLDNLERAGRARRGGVTNPTTFLAACDVVALPYVTTSIFHPPQVLLESFAASTAVITTSLGGLGEMVQAGITGEIVLPRRADVLCAALERRLGDLGGTHTMGREARRQFEHDGCAETTVERLLGLIR